MRSLPLFLLFPLIGSGVPTHHKVGKPSPGSNWTRSSTPPLVLAKEVEARLHTLSNAKVQFMFSVDLPGIGKGSRGCQCFVVNPKVFHIEIPRVGGGKFPLSATTIVSDGKVMGSKPEGGKLQLAAFTKQRHLPSHLLKDWLNNGVGYVMESICSSATPLTQIVSEASRPGSGFQTYCETRTVTISGLRTRYDRIVVTRTNLNPFYEIVVNEHYMLPTSMSSTVHRGKKVSTSDMAGSEWGPIQQRLDPRIFNPKLLK